MAAREPSEIDSTNSPSSIVPVEPSRERGKGAEVFYVSPFKRLARAHGLGVGGDALIAIALADSLFFSIDPNDARWKVALYLLLTIAPFGLIAPFLGPAMDRVKGGHRIMIIAVGVARAILALAMVRYVSTLLLFPLAFSLLVFGKAHHVAKSSLVPTLVDSDEALVKANSRLSIVSALSGGLAGIPGVLLLRFGGGGPSVLTLAVVLFSLGALFALKIPATLVAEEGPDEEEKAELRSTGIFLAASTMAYVRGLVGFLTMLVAFELRRDVDPGPISVGVEIAHRLRENMGLERLELATGGKPAWHFGVVLLAMGIGGLAGAFAAPRLRAHVSEERILAGVLGGVAILGLLGALSGGLLGAMIVAFIVSFAGTAGKQSFDAIVQRDAPEANLGRSFGRFESRFQLAWVFGAIIPVVLHIPLRLGFLILAIPAGFAGVSYWFGRDPAIQTDRARRGVETVKDKARTRRARRREDAMAPEDMHTVEIPAVRTSRVDTIELGWAEDTQVLPSAPGGGLDSTQVLPSAAPPSAPPPTPEPSSPPAPSIPPEPPRRPEA